MSMTFTVHNVGHGFCASLIHSNGNVMLWDCGHKDDCRPSSFLPASGITRVDNFFVTNYDEDHISDLPNLCNAVTVRALWRNKSVSADQLRNIKLPGGPISPAMDSMIGMIQSYIYDPPSPAPDFPGVRFKTFHNLLGSEFTDTNNISLVTFLECGDSKFVIPGDLGTKGWLNLLQSKDFCTELGGVNVFIASHHGREDGYCKDVFKYCKPDVVVFSDSNIKYATQEMSDTYTTHASGVPFGGKTRYVLSTRKDGSIEWPIN